MKPKICFISLPAYPILAKKDFKKAGGAELQLSMIAKELAKKGYDVSFVTFDYGQKPIEVIDNIKIIKAFKPNKKSGISRIRYEMRGLSRALRKADADIYHQRSGWYLPGLTALFCSLHKKKFVYSTAHIIQCKKDFLIPLLKKDRSKIGKISFISKLLYQYAIYKADLVFTQMKEHQRLLKKNFHKNSEVIPNAHILPKTIPKKKSLIVLWVATIKNWKNPEMFIELAKNIPKTKFVMIGGPEFEGNRYYEEIKQKAKKIKNLEFKGFIPVDKIGKEFDKASIFVNTSDYEGFPNTFIQSWSRAIPTISLNVDPDDVIKTKHIGFHSKSFKNLVNDTKLLIEDKKLRQKLGSNAKKHCHKYHDLKKVIKNYIEAYDRLIKK